MSSLHDRIAKRLLTAHGRVLSRRIASGWWTSVKNSVENSDMQVMQACSTKVVFGDKVAKLQCEIAEDDQSQTVGLQKYASLPNGYGMLFPYDPPRDRVAFHMGTVPFPIDIIFVGSNGRVSKIVENAEPGTRDRWGMSHISAVVEANGGFCGANGIEVGMPVNLGIDKQAQESFDGTPRKDINPVMTPTNDTLDRFKGHDTPDNILEDQPMSPGNWDSQMGYDPSSLGEQQDDIMPMRPAAKKIKR